MQEQKEKHESASELKKIVHEWLKEHVGENGIKLLALLRRRFGIVGIAAAILVVGAWLILGNWENINKLPLVPELTKFFSQQSLPHADSKRFSIAVAHLQGDSNSELEQILVDALERFVHVDKDSGVPDLQILRFDRTIDLKGGDGEIAAKKDHEEARRLLTESGADVLLWGSVLRQGSDKIRSKMYWTSIAEDARGQSKSL